MKPIDIEKFLQQAIPEPGKYIYVQNHYQQNILNSTTIQTIIISYTSQFDKELEQYLITVGNAHYLFEHVIKQLFPYQDFPQNPGTLTWHHAITIDGEGQDTYFLLGEEDQQIAQVNIIITSFSTYIILTDIITDL